MYRPAPGTLGAILLTVVAVATVGVLSPGPTWIGLAAAAAVAVLGPVVVWHARTGMDVGEK